MPRLRVLHTVEFYHPHPGGAERVVQRLSEGLVRLGHEVSVATSWDPGRSGDTLNGVRVVPFRVTGNLARGMRGEVERYRRWVLDGRFDVIMTYAAQCWPTDALLPLLPEMGAAKVFATCGFSGLHGVRRLLYFGYFRALRAWIRGYDALVYHARTGADVAFGKKFGPARQVVIPNGADGAEFASGAGEFRARHGIAARHLLLHVGNHYKVKGHGDLLELMGDLRDLDAALVIIGSAPSAGRSCWTSCAAAAGRDPRVRLLAGLPREEVVAAFREADLVLLPSRFEAASLVLVEAMAAGVPFVAYDVGNARELPGGVVVRDRTELRRAVRHMLVDEAERRALGEAGRSYQRRHLEWDGIVAEYERLYVSLVAARAGG